MNFHLKTAVPSALATAFLLAGFEAKASAVQNEPGAVTRHVTALAIPADEPDDPQCDLAQRIKLTGASGRSQAGGREKSPRSAPGAIEPPVFVKNPFLSTAP